MRLCIVPGLPTHLVQEFNGGTVVPGVKRFTSIFVLWRDQDKMAIELGEDTVTAITLDTTSSVG